jgi:transcriptional regulator with XRE-family HTH domain
MTLGRKLRYLRQLEGIVRGLGRDLTQAEVVSEIRQRLGRGISQSYLSQVENGARRHLTNSTRLLLARFFQVHPGYLVDDPEGFHTELVSDIAASEDHLDLWLISGAERFARDPELRQALLAVAQHADSRACLALLGAIIETPGLGERLTQVLLPHREAASARHRRSGRRSG